MRRQFTRWFCGTLVLILACLASRAQTSGAATVAGTVTDTSGAVVTNANVELRDQGTNVARSTKTNGAGHYAFESVLPGNYALQVSEEGFRTAELEIKVDVARSYSFNVKLELGQASQVVTVNAAALQLETTDATVGDVLQQDSIMRLPNINRDTTTYLFLQPTANPAPSSAANSTLTTANSGQISGARSDQNNMMLDGVDVTDRGSGAQSSGPLSQVQQIQPVAPVPAESVEEFRVGVANPTADFGLSAGGQVNMVTKRGTNSLHGSVYDYFQNDALNANSWDRDLLGQRKAALRDNRFGASLGGPILKSKTFFFLNYEGRRFPHSDTITRLVPTDTVRAGTLRFRDATGNVVSYPVASFDPRSLGLNPIISNYWSLLPAGNDPSQGDGLNIIGFTAPASAPLSTNFGVVRLDHQLNNKWQITSTFRYAQGIDESSNQVDIAGLLPGDKRGVPASVANQPGQQRLVTVGLTGALSNSLMTNFRFGWYRDYLGSRGVTPFPQVPGTNVALLVAGGIAGQAGQPTVRLLDQPVDADAQRSRSGDGQGNGTQFLASLSWVRGSHVFSFGGSFYRYRGTSTSNDAAGLGLSVPVAQVDSLSNTPVPASEQPPPCGGGVTTNCLNTPGDVATWNRLYYASLGVIDNVAYVSARNGTFAPLSPGSPVVTNFTNYVPQFYFDDTWHLRPSLTLNLGVTYEWQTPPVEDQKRMSLLLDEQTGQKIVSSQYFAAKQAAALQGDIFNPTLALQTVSNLHRSAVTNTDWKNIGPRVGVAWNPSAHTGILGRLIGSSKTVVRGGYSLVYDRLNATNANIESSLGAFYQGLAINGPVNGAGQPFRIGADGPAPLPVVPTETLPYVPSIPFGLLFSVLENPTNTIGRAHLLDLTIQRELPGNLFLEVGYVGRLGRNLRMDTTLNAAPYFMVDKVSKQTFAQAYDAVAKQLRPPAGVPINAIAAQPWFENYLSAVSSGCGGGSTNATQCIAFLDGGDFLNGGVSSLWQTNMDIVRLLSGQSTELNLQTIDPIVRVGGTNANYNAVFVSLHRQMSHGFTFDVNYTFSKSLDEAGNVQDNGQGFSSPYNPHLDYGPSQFDRTHVLNAHWYEDLPFGKGHRLSASGVPDKLVGGWYTAGIFTANSGLPLCPTYGSGAFGGGLIIAPPNCGVPITSMNPGNSIHGSGANRNLFADHQAVLANYRQILIAQDTRNPRGTLRGLSAWQLDLSFGKVTNLTEKVRTVFSADFINAFNHPLFGDPTLDMTSPETFGSIPITQRNFPRSVQLALRVEF